MSMMMLLGTKPYQRAIGSIVIYIMRVRLEYLKFYVAR